MDLVMVNKIKKKRNMVKLELPDRAREKIRVTGNKTLSKRAKTLTVFEGMHRKIE
jgi:hypothetical protein